MKGPEFKKARRQLLLTQTQLAQSLGLSRPTVSYYENGHSDVPISVQLAIDQLLSKIEDDSEAIPDVAKPDMRRKGLTVEP